MNQIDLLHLLADNSCVGFSWVPMSPEDSRKQVFQASLGANTTNVLFSLDSSEAQILETLKHVKAVLSRTKGCGCGCGKSKEAPEAPVQEVTE